MSQETRVLTPREISDGSEWVVKVTEKDTISVTCPKGFEDMVGEEIPLEVLGHAISAAVSSQTRTLACKLY